MAYLRQKLVAEKVLSGSSAQDDLTELVCNPKNQKCMYGECSECSGKRVSFNLPRENAEKLVTYQQQR